MSTLIIHNIMWSAYKAEVFSELNILARAENKKISFVQIAETEKGRKSISALDTKWHNYPFELLFEGAYEDIGWWSKSASLIKVIYKNKTNTVILPGFHEKEYWVALLLCMVLRKNIGVFCDSTIFDRKQKFISGILKRVFFSICDGFFVYGVRAADYVIHYGAKKENVYIRCQASATFSKVSIEHINDRRTIPLADKIKLLYVGRLSPEKNLQKLLLAIPILLKNNIEVELSIVGDGGDRSVLEMMAVDLNIDKNVIFRGSKSIEELVNYYMDADVFVLPSLSEPWGLVINEAMRHALPCVVSNICGCVPELIYDNNTGVTFDPKSEDELAYAIIKIIELIKSDKKLHTRIISTIKKYTPKNAAMQIINGIKSMEEKA